jgi:hypothetical protein
MRDLGLPAKHGRCYAKILHRDIACDESVECDLIETLSPFALDQFGALFGKRIVGNS